MLNLIARFIHSKIDNEKDHTKVVHMFIYIKLPKLNFYTIMDIIFRIYRNVTLKTKDRIFFEVTSSNSMVQKIYYILQTVVANSC